MNHIKPFDQFNESLFSNLKDKFSDVLNKGKNFFFNLPSHDSIIDKVDNMSDEEMISKLNSISGKSKSRQGLFSIHVFLQMFTEMFFDSESIKVFFQNSLFTQLAIVVYILIFHLMIREGMIARRCQEIIDEIN